MSKKNQMVCALPWALLSGLALAATSLAQAHLVEIRQETTVHDLAWSPDGKRLASAWEDGFIRITETSSGKESVKLNAGAPVIGVVFSADGKVLGIKSGAKDGPLSIWDIGTQKKLKQLAFNGYSCNKLAFTRDGLMLVASGPGEHMVWSHAKGGGYGSKQDKVAEGSAAAVSPSGRFAVWCTPQGLVQFFDTDQRKHQRMQIGPALALAFSADGSSMAVAAPDKSIRLWAVHGAETNKLEGLREPAKLLHFSANGKVLAAASPGDPVVRLWDVGTGRLRRRLTGNPVGVTALALSPDGLNLALGHGNRVVVWNVATRELGDLGQPKALSAAELKTAWTDLANHDHAKAEAAFRQLATAQHNALGFLKEQVRAIAVPAVDFKRVDKLLIELDNPMYPVRQRASQELARLGEAVQKAVENYLAAKPSLEGDRRAKKLLERLQYPELTPDRLRCLETIEILEIWQTAQSRGLLNEIAREALIAQVRTAAREALERWNRAEKKEKEPKSLP